MARRKNAFNKKVIDAVFSTPFILLGPTKRDRKKAAKKWWKAMEQSMKR